MERDCKFRVDKLGKIEVANALTADVLKAMTLAVVRLRTCPPFSPKAWAEVMAATCALDIVTNVDAEITLT